MELILLSAACSLNPRPTNAFHCLLKQISLLTFNRNFVSASQKGDELRNAIFSVDIGQYDLANSLGLSHKQIVDEKIPPALASIKNAIKLLYELGARKFVIYSTGPFGYLPRILDGLRKGDHHLRLDKVGCSVDCNELVRTFNDGLSSLLAAIRSQMEEALIVYVVMKSPNFSLIFASRLQNPLIPFPSQEGSAPTICLDPSRAVNWDGIHYSEAANSIIASKIWFGKYASPYIKFKDLCEMAIKD
ncbi:hypothetical protein Cgig2_016524 [Carnegiea gigantea]|uniref:GDSL esterase/lipase n=1 Tax=Carnegiea gigantea TaxID=171969 RepID=A0A9Q1JYS2_9CARY|nr:hypothetical protein Cgig2_016524 [Carnegiea gigantea]